jgi:phosphate starvation-inducible membrane PsiE
MTQEMRILLAEDEPSAAAILASAAIITMIGTAEVSRRRRLPAS